MSALSLPTEEIEQRIFVQWLEIKKLKFTAIPNSTYTKSIQQKMKNKYMGLRAGLPDLLVIVSNQVIWIEMKRVKGGVVSATQKAWIEALNDAGTPAYVCAGADEAIKVVEQKLNYQKVGKAIKQNNNIF